MDGISSKEWYSRFGWEKNPFTLEIYPELLVGYARQARAFIDSVEGGQKHILITGPTGAGKTTILKWLSAKYSSIYLSKPPRKEEEIIAIFSSTVLRSGILKRLLFPGRLSDTTMYNLADKINQKTKGKKTVLLVDEAHETEIEILEWLRTISDQVEGMTLVLAGLPKIKETHLSKLETFSQRITVNIELTALNKEESLELIRKRIMNCGGRNLDPFTMDALNEVYARSGGVPREILKACNSIIQKAIERNSSIIDASYFDDVRETDIAIDAREQLERLTDKQREIIDLLIDNKSMTPTQLTESLNLDDYQSKIHALRAINNILRRLETNHLVVRERRGKTYKYSISPKVKNVLVEA